MLAKCYHISITILWLLAFISSAAADPVCDPIYGQPTYSDCRDLVIALYSGWPGQITDQREHYFSLRGERPPPWINPDALDSQKYLPRFAFQGRSALIDHGIRSSYNVLEP